MPVYPVNLQINGRPCVVVGGGNVAERKVQSLLAADASVTLISPQVTGALAELVEQKKIVHIPRTYKHGDIVGFFIVICATDSGTVNKLVAKEASKAGVLVNVADAPELGNFSVPSKITRGDLLLTISTGGKSPALARRLREELAECYGPEYGEYLDLLAEARDKIKEILPTTKDREIFWRQTIDQDVIMLLKQGKIKEAEARINNAIGCVRAES